jgi:hypothetical protein
MNPAKKILRLLVGFSIIHHTKHKREETRDKRQERHKKKKRMKEKSVQFLM